MSALAADFRIDAALDAERRAWGHIVPGERLISNSARALRPVPKFSAGGAGKRRSVSKLQEWLVWEAQKEGVDSGANRWAADELAEMNPSNMSQSQADMLLEILFGDRRGPGPQHRTGVQP